MEIDYAALVPFAIINIFSPGPNNILATTMGIRFGYRRTLPFLLGIWSGFFLIFLTCAALATILLSSFDQFERIISIVGAVYILWLAYKTLKTTYEFSGEQKTPLAFHDGLLLQLMNPKVIVFGLTIFSTFLAQLPRSPLPFIIAPAIFATVSFTSTSTWTLTGATIASIMHHTPVARIVNSAMALALVLIAIDLSGILHLF